MPSAAIPIEYRSTQVGVKGICSGNGATGQLSRTCQYRPPPEHQVRQLKNDSISSFALLSLHFFWLFLLLFFEIFERDFPFF